MYKHSHNTIHSYDSAVSLNMFGGSLVLSEIFLCVRSACAIERSSHHINVTYIENGLGVWAPSNGSSHRHTDVAHSQGRNVLHIVE